MDPHHTVSQLTSSVIKGTTCSLHLLSNKSKSTCPVRVKAVVNFALGFFDDIHCNAFENTGLVSSIFFTLHTEGPN